MPNNSDLGLFENFIETIAQILSRALSNKDTEKLLVSFSALQTRLRQLSEDNLAKSARNKPKFCKHSSSCLSNCGYSIIRTFIITYSLKYGLGFVPSLLTGKIFKDSKLIYKLGGSDTTSFAAFITGLISTYKGVLCLLRNYRRKNDPLNAFVAGFLSGFSILLDKNETRRIMVSLYLTTRTFHFMARWLWRHHFYQYFETRTRPNLSQEKSPTSPRFQSFFRPKQARAIPQAESTQVPDDPDDELHTHHPSRQWIRQAFGTITMAVSSSQILYAYVCEPDTLAKSYLSFLITHGGIRSLQPKRSRQYLNAFGSTITASSASGASKFIPNKAKFSEMLPKELPLSTLEPFSSFLMQKPHEFVMCAIQHPSREFCGMGAVDAFAGEWLRAIKLYAPLNIVLTIIFKGGKILKNPLHSFYSTTKSTLRSVLFLSLYVTTAWSLPCLFRNLRGKDEKWMYYVNGFLAGLMVLIEQPGRRLELGMYCLPRAFESGWNGLVARGIVQNIKYGEALYFSVFTGIMMTIYQNEPGSIHKTYRKLLFRLFGVN